MGDSASGDWLFVDFSLPTARSASVSKIAPTDFGVLAFSLAGISNHGRRGLDQIARGRLLARPDLHVLPLRNPADPESDQPVPSFSAAVVSQAGGNLEPFCRADRAVVFIWSANRSAHCRRIARPFPGHSHHQRQSVIFELSDDHSVRRLFRRHVAAPDPAQISGEARPGRRGAVATIAASQSSHYWISRPGCLVEHSNGDESRRWPPVGEFVLLSSLSGV